MKSSVSLGISNMTACPAKDLQTYSDALKLSADHIWQTEQVQSVSYPKTQTNEKFRIEDDSFWFNHRNACILQAITHHPPSGLLIDVGGGNGFVTRGIQQAGYETALLEPNLQGIKNARKRGISNLICSTWQDAKFKQNTLPAIGLFDVLEHIEDDLGFLKNMHQALQENGRLYLTVPAHQFLWSAVDEFDGHYRRYSPKTLSLILQSAGFSVRFITYFFGFLMPPIFLLRTLPSRLKFMKPDNIENTSQDDKVPPLFNALFGWFGQKELETIKNGKSLSLGSSCLCVADKLS